MSDKKRNILIMMGRYLPGYKDGGPVRTIKNLTDYLGQDYNFKILACDRDHGDEKSYDNIIVNGWNRVGNANVYYVAPKGFSVKLIEQLSKEVDLIYCCGCFNDYAINLLLANRLGKIKVPVIVAAMGLFSPMEFRLKYKKKKLFTTVFNILGMFRNIYWSATSEMEIFEICQQVWAKKDQFFIAEDLPRKVDETPILKKKVAGSLDVVWISRIAPKKNLKAAIEILKNVKSNINFTIYGPIHVQEYWDECKVELEKLPSNIIWEHKGNVESEEVVEKLKEHHVFLFPTLGENYGHVIQEALSAGCPCILSDQTPWKDLEAEGVGAVYRLDEKDRFVFSIENYARMNQDEWDSIVVNAKTYAIKNSNTKVQKTGYRLIFDSLVGEK